MVLFWLMVLKKGLLVLKKDKPIYKEKKFIVKIMSMGARYLSLNEYFSVKYICMERVKV